MTWPDAVPFDPSQGTAAQGTEALLGGSGSAQPVLLFAVGPQAQQQGWAARAAIALAEAFAARGDSAILADLSLNQPELHTLLDVSNDEGLTDVFLFGASIEHTWITIPDKSFRLIPASPYTPDAGEVLRHVRWQSLLEHFAHKESMLLAYVPVDLDGADVMAERVGHAIVLATRAEIDHVRGRLRSDVDVIAVLTPPEPVAVATTPSIERRDEKEFQRIRIPKDGAREALIAELRARQRAALQGPAPEMAPLPHEASSVVPVGEPPSQPAQPGPVFTLAVPQPLPQKRPAWILWFAILALIVGLGAAGWYFWQSRQSSTKASPPAAGPAQAAPAVTAPVAPTADSTKADSVLAYSVAIASYHDLEVALGRLDQLAEQSPDLAFYIGPIDVQGRVFYRIMAGPLADSGSAVLLRDTLIVRRIKTISSGWDVLNTRYAFLLGNYPRRADAEAQRDIAVSKGVPSYIVETKTPGGTQVYNVYAGAYSGRGEAEFMRPLLKSAGFPDNLVERTGNIRS